MKHPAVNIKTVFTTHPAQIFKLFTATIDVYFLLVFYYTFGRPIELLQQNKMVRNFDTNVKYLQVTLKSIILPQCSVWCWTCSFPFARYS